MRYITIKKFTLDSLLMNTAMFCVFSYALLEDSSISIPLMSYFKMPLVVLGAVCMLLLAKVYIFKLTDRKYFGTFLLLFVFFAMLGWTVYMNRKPIFGEVPLRSTLRLILYLIDLFVLMVVAAEKGKSRDVMRFLYHYLLLLALINDVLMFTRLMSFTTGRYESYLVGTKFSVAYLHMNLLTVWMMNNKRTIMSYRLSLGKIILAALFVIAISFRTDCMTGVLGCVILVVLFILIESPNRGRLLRFTTPGMLLLSMAGSVVFAFVAEIVLSLPFVTYLIKNVFGRDTSLTGRTVVYLRYIQTIPTHWLTGYGYGNAYEVTSTQFYYDNVQNALLQWGLQIGVIATVGLVLLLLKIFGQISWKNTRNMPRILLLVALIYTYVILGTIETTLNMAMILWFALIFMLVNEKATERDAVL